MKPDIAPDIHYYLGQCEHLDLNWDKAKEEYEKYRATLSYTKKEDKTNIDDVEKISKDTYEKIKKIKPQPKYDLIIDNLYKKEAIKFIIDNPFRYFKLFITKIFSFLFIDLNSSYPNYYNIFHIIPKILISIPTFIGILLLINKKDILTFFAFYYLLSGFIFSIFFILPRYNLALLPIQVILTCHVLQKIKFIKK
jgi:hypothetical protein